MLEKLLIAHCAPTLAGIKTGNLFNYCFPSTDDLLFEMEDASGKLNGKGIRLEIPRVQSASALILAYRPVRLERDLAKKGATDLLAGFGYEMSSDSLKMKGRTASVQAAGRFTATKRRRSNCLTGIGNVGMSI